MGTGSGSRNSLLTQNAYFSNDAQTFTPAAIHTAIPEIDGVGAGDLFLYPVEDFSLKKDETAEEASAG